MTRNEHFADGAKGSQEQADSHDSWHAVNGQRPCGDCTPKERAVRFAKIDGRPNRHYR